MAKTAKKPAKIKPVKAWGGFYRGRLDMVQADYGWGGYGAGDFVSMPAIFKSRKLAKERYQDVRPVIISPAPKRKAK